MPRRRNQVWLVAGSVFRTGGVPRLHTASVINSGGEVVLRYRKQFPFCPYEQGVAPGETFAVSTLPGRRPRRRDDLLRHVVSGNRACTRMARRGGHRLPDHDEHDRPGRRAWPLRAAMPLATSSISFNIKRSAGRFGVGQSIVVGPDGAVVHRAGHGREVICSRTRPWPTCAASVERGMHGLGQTLKSFRDSTLRYPQYGLDRSPCLDQLGRTVPAESRPDRG